MEFAYLALGGVLVFAGAILGAIFVGVGYSMSKPVDQKRKPDPSMDI